MNKARHSRRRFPPFLAVTLTIIIATCPILWSNAETQGEEVQTEETAVPNEEAAAPTEEAPALPETGTPDEILPQPDPPALAESTSEAPATPTIEETSAVPPSALPGQEPDLTDGQISSEPSAEGQENTTVPDPAVVPSTEEGTKQTTEMNPTDSAAEEPAHQHDASCGYRAPQPEVPCDRACTDTDGDGLINHSVDCAFRPADPGSPCRFDPTNHTEGPSDPAAKPVKPQESLPAKEEPSSETEQTESSAVSGNDTAETQETVSQTEALPDEDASEEDTSADLKTDHSVPEEEESTQCTEEETETETAPENPTEGGGEDPLPEDISGNSISGNDITDPSSEAEISLTGDPVSGNDISSNDLLADPESQNAPSFAIAIPAKVILNETNSFPIELLSDQPDRIGSVLVTVEGTTSPDGRYYALYCGQSWWSYQLLMDGNQLNPRQNQVMLTPREGARQVQILSAGDKMYAGTYNGSLRFSVSYQTEPESSAE